MAEANLVETIKYIAQREEELAKYSSKLRKAVAKIFDVFGDSERCQVCDREEHSYNHFKYTIRNEYGGFDVTNDDEKVQKMLQSGKYVLINAKDFDNVWNKDGKLVILKNESHPFKPKIELSLEMVGKPFYTDEEGHSYGLAIRDHKLIIREFDELGEWWYDSTDITFKVSRKVLKELVKTKAITEFLKMYIEKLDNTTEEYKAVSEIAEKMASVI